MPTVLEGELLPGDEAYAIVVSRFNRTITDKLLEGAISTFKKHGLSASRITVAWVPGAFEIPLVARRLAESGQFAAVCCLGAVIQGQTSHHEYINQQVAAGLTRIGEDTGVPAIFGVLTCFSMDQALERAGGKVGNKGSDAALAAIEMASLLRKLPGQAK